MALLVFHYADLALGACTVGRTTVAVLAFVSIAGVIAAVRADRLAVTRTIAFIFALILFAAPVTTSYTQFFLIGVLAATFTVHSRY